MTPDELEVAVCDFVEDVVPGLVVARRSGGAVTLAYPYAVVGIVSDVQDQPTDTVPIDGSTNVAYSGLRQFRAQVDIIGTDAARNNCQRVAMMWAADCAARRTIVAAGVGPQTAGTWRDTSATRGGAGFVRSASVDLFGSYRLVYGDEAPDGILVETVSGTYRNVGGSTYTASLDVD